MSHWSRNHGLKLVWIAGVAVAVSSFCAFFELVPDVAFSESSAQLTTSPRQPQGTYVARVEIAPRIMSVLEKTRGDDEAEQDGQIDGGILFVSKKNEGTIDFSAPGFTFFFSADPAGSATLVETIPQGNYVVAAFLDIDGNGQLDLDASGRPVEPIKVARVPAHLVVEGDQQLFNVVDGAIYYHRFYFQ